VAELAIRSLLARFAWTIDRDGGRGMGGFFTEDAVLYLPNPGDELRPTLALRGRVAIAARWEGRAASIVTRHVGVNCDIRFLDEARATARSVGLGFRYDGEGLGPPVPAVVADYDDVCVRCEDGEWRFRERRITPVFLDPDRLPR
jgi:hypothetical protein